MWFKNRNNLIDSTTQREKVLKNVRNAIIYKDKIVDIPERDDDIFVDKKENTLEIVFAENFTLNGGKFTYFDNFTSFQNKIIEIIRKINSDKIYCDDDYTQKILMANEINYIDKLDNNDITISITKCELVAARSGSVIFTSNDYDNMIATSHSSLHIIIARPTQFVYDIRFAINKIIDRYNGFPRSVFVVSGPSKTITHNNDIYNRCIGPSNVLFYLIDF